MFSIMEIAANKVLETDGIDSLSGVCAPTLVPTVGSFQTIFAMFQSAKDSFYLQDNQRALWPAATGYEVAIPGRPEILVYLVTHNVTFRVTRYTRVSAFTEWSRVVA